MCTRRSRLPEHYSTLMVDMRAQRTGPVGRKDQTNIVLDDARRAQSRSATLARSRSTTALHGGWTNTE